MTDGLAAHHRGRPRPGQPSRARPLSRWLRWDNGTISHKYDERVPRGKDELRAGGEGMLGTFHEIFQSAGVEEVEFFLPISAINLNVDM